MRIIKKQALLSSLVALGLLVGLVPDTAMAGCRINWAIQNNSGENIWVSQSQVKSKGGSWKRAFTYNGKLETAFHLKPGAKIMKVYNATFGCKAKRRWRFEVTNSNGCSKQVYYPSPTGWTTSSDINFGDVSRHCK